MKHRVGYLLDEVKEGYILQQVNCQGVMGSGIAKAIRDKWPVVHSEYYRWTKGVDPVNLLGHFQVIEVEPRPLTNEKLYVVNLFSQVDYGRDGRRYTSYDGLNDALHGFSVNYIRQGCTGKIHHPMIGCGLGGGQWPIVRSIIETWIGSDTTVWTLPGEGLTTEYLVR